MSYEAIEKRYALALFELAKEHQQLDQIENELRVIKSVFENNDEFQKLLKSPKISRDQKQIMINEVLANVSTFTLNTISLLVDRHRDELIVSVCDAFIEQVHNERGIADATVFSVRPLTAEETESISNVFAKKVGKQSLNIVNVIDRDLLGGLKIKIKNSIFDSSLRGKLDRLERTLIS
ncbi:F0F1 ATP synthase subunit delta [Bacillus ginsengihumi]|uniref:ATP synthase subunit delta n=1 Tax=Heyndrickxia ginsengihumi TaxID=363870 RepID=A0A0A6VGH9_9BACI|nr:F0F1 ATP synthase subunit delta [Heyndrickxia ginsengihumi]KHD86691.1 ATP synthase F0F1 subunit delta [Heyndrickxia ginsengihumi]MBE6184662.1 F0F1 ATP synthase subunit delta [Bacillus sp. (in: firmicutes)]NEY18386.1 F0F1 ATP synthase subunit delta [Heyndrickxia ginsengihumi]